MRNVFLRRLRKPFACFRIFLWRAWAGIVAHQAVTLTSDAVLELSGCRDLEPLCSGLFGLHLRHFISPVVELTPYRRPRVHELEGMPFAQTARKRRLMTDQGQRIKRPICCYCRRFRTARRRASRSARRFGILRPTQARQTRKGKASRPKSKTISIGFPLPESVTPKCGKLKRVQDRAAIALAPPPE